MLAGIDLTFVAHIADIDWIVQDVPERAVSERDATDLSAIFVDAGFGRDAGVGQLFFQGDGRTQRR